MTGAETYDRWYETPHGRWIGEREASLVLDCLQTLPGESLLDVGCGTGFFTRELAGRMDGPVAGVDIDPERVKYARWRDPGRASYAVGDARALPYADRSFDLAVSVTALCFIDEEANAVREILRVARRKFAIGLLNRHSLLWLQKGTHGEQGGYRGARWHTVREAQRLFHDLPVQCLQVRTAIQIPSGGSFAHLVERLWPASLGYGAFLLVAGDVPAPNDEVA